MKLFVAFALLFWALAEAHHIPEHNLSGPRFVLHKTHSYNVRWEMASSVKGIRPQASKSVMSATVNIYATTAKNYLMEVENVLVSNSVPAAASVYSDVPMVKDEKLERLLSKSIQFTYEEGRVTGYTMDPEDDLVSQKIKKSILRSLEMSVDQRAVEKARSESKMDLPVTYSITKKSRVGDYVSKYMIMVSPYPDYPKDVNVFNISRVDDYESHRYDSYIYYHNFQKQGCPEVCTKNLMTNTYGAGCPVGYEPHHSPIKMSFTRHHNWNLVEGVMVPEIMETKEVHVAHMYDQNMEVNIRVYLRRTMLSQKIIPVPHEQQWYHDLHDMDEEIKETETDSLCKYESRSEAVMEAKNLLKKVTEIIVKGNLNDTKSTLLGEKIYLLQQAFRKLKKDDFHTVEDIIERLESIPQASEENKVMRQVWTEILPLIGTEDSVSYIVEYIRDGVPGSVEVWEAKDILQALPWNILKPKEETVKLLKELWRSDIVNKHHVLHSAAHLTVAHVIARLCSPSQMQPLPTQKSSWFSNENAAFENMQQSSASETKPVCPEHLVREIVRELKEKLHRTTSKHEIPIYIDALANIGTLEVLPILSDYAHGTPRNIWRYSPRFINFIKTVTMYSFHNLVSRYPEHVLDILRPIYFNITESPVVRNAAFGAMMRCNPSLELLKHIVQDTWNEPSYEVGSYVTSTLESFGNSTLPCYQVTATRIKKVISEAKRFDAGSQHSKNYHFSYFDAIRDFSLEKRMEYVASNESYFPRALYGAYYYTIDSLRDVFYQYALNIEGVSQSTVWKRLYEMFGITSAKDIPKSMEKALFSGTDLVNRVPEMLRFTVFQRMFYTSHYYYLDEDSMQQIMAPLMKHIDNFMKLGKRKLDGHLVKLYLPSYHHTVTISKAIPYPVEFQMKHALVLSLKVKSLNQEKNTPNDFYYSIRPSVYFSKLYTNQIKNLGDCKEVGVYHEHKLAVSHAFEIKGKFNLPSKVEASYSVPRQETKVLFYHSECGTYAGKKSLRTLPSMENRVPVKTIPSPFKKEGNIKIIGFPAIHARLHTEDIRYGMHDIPSGPWDMAHLFFTKICNSGWRRTSMNVTFKPEDFGHEVNFTLSLTKRHVIKSEQESLQSAPKETEGSWLWRWNDKTEPKENVPDWEKELHPDEPTVKNSSATYAIEGATVYKILHNDLPHVLETLSLTIKSKQVQSWFKFDVEHRYTHDKRLHFLHLHSDSQIGSAHPIKFSVSHIAGHIARPNEFKYDTHKFGSQECVFITTMSPEAKGPFEDASGVVKGFLKYVNVADVLENEVAGHVDRKYFYPETHETCLRHVKEGKAQSVECMKAVREHSIYNNIKLNAYWLKKGQVPEIIRNTWFKLENLLKHIYYENIRIPVAVWRSPTQLSNSEWSWEFTSQYIDRMTDVPVLDISIKKGEDMITYRKVDAELYPPFSSIYMLKDIYLYRHTNNSYPVTCGLMEKYVRTFDMKTFKKPKSPCEYLVASHCTKVKKFAITATDMQNKKEIHVYIGGHKIVLSKEESKYKIVHGTEIRPISLSLPVIFDENQEVYAYLTKTTEKEPILELYAEKAGIAIKYDGKNLRLKVHPMYKGELCGLCSGFDGEETQEYRGPNKCLYANSEDFIKSTLLGKGTCEREQHSERICDYGEPKVWPPMNEIETHHYEPTIKRNIVVPQGNEICFSILPYPVCNENKVPEESKKEEVGFHCLPKRDITAKKLVTEAKRRVLGEIQGKSVDFKNDVEIPILC